MNKHTKALMSILVISMLFVSSTPLMVKGFGVPAGSDSEDWYMTVNGVLSTDKYSLYPYEKKDLTIGFSQFGEMINSLDNIGLQYGTEDEPGRDPFAPPYDSEVGALPKYVWLEGWLINITYFTPKGKMRNVWATAQHTDLGTYQYGNDWVRIDDNYPGGPDSEFDESPYAGYVGLFIGTEASPQYGSGGRETNGTVVTEPIQVLYDGPRRFVAQLVNHIYDWVQSGDSVTETTSIHLVDVIITIDFNKDKKEVNLLKDVKLIPIKGIFSDIPASYWQGDVPEGYKVEKFSMPWGLQNFLLKWDEGLDLWMGYTDRYLGEGTWTIEPTDAEYPGYLMIDYPITSPIEGIFVQFSNRGQWDLGKPNDYASYVHFYTMGEMDNSPLDAGWHEYPFWWTPDLTWPDTATYDDEWAEFLYTVYGNDYTLTSTIAPNLYSRHGPEPWPPADPNFAPGWLFLQTMGSNFDLAQVISDDEEYVGWAAYWPSLSDWSVRGMDLGQYWRSLSSFDTHPTDYSGEAWQSPYLIGEWDFVLSRTSQTYYYNMYNRYEMGAFKMDKQFRGVTVYGLTDLHTDVYGPAGAEPYEFPDYEWCDYDGGFEGPKILTEAEFEADFGRRLHLYEPDWIPCVGAGYDAEMSASTSGYQDCNVIDREVAYQLYEKFRPWDLQKSVEKESARWVEFGLGLSSDDEYTGEQLNDGPLVGADQLSDLWAVVGYDVFDDEASYDWIYLEMTEDLVFYSQTFPDHPDDWLGGWSIWPNWQSAHEIGEWFAYCTFPERVLVELDPEDHPGELTLLVRGVDYLLYDGQDDDDGEEIYVIFIDDGDPEKPLEIEEGALIKVLYSTWGLFYDVVASEPSVEELFQIDYGLYGGGVYEWITAGRDAASVDSLGASMITEAFDSVKCIPVRMPSLDMQEPVYCPTVPFLLRKFGTGNTRADYYYDYPDDFRLALRDDWSSTVPIASSNIISVGGPLANAVTEYFNEFEMAIYRGMAGAATPANDILLVSDWGSTFNDQSGTGLTGPDGEVTTIPDITIPGVIVEEDLGKTGIGIVSTYKDINGTVGLVVYGYSGEDTVWTSKLFYNMEIPIFLDDGNGVLDWDDDNDNGILDPEDLSETPETYFIEDDGDVYHPKLGWIEYWWKYYDEDLDKWEGFGFWAGDDLMLGFIDIDNEGNQKWTFLPGIMLLQFENPGVVELVIKLYYELPNSMNPYVIDTGELFSTDVHPVALVVEELGTVSEKPQHPDP